MTTTGQIDRRSLLASTAAAGGAFVLGFEFPVPDIAQAAEDGPEINAWVIIHCRSRKSHPHGLAR
jgi:hypothetical protein